MSPVAIPDIYDIRTNLKWIRRILQYWFTIPTTPTTTTPTDVVSDEPSNSNSNTNRNDIALLQKRLWMISQQNDTLRSNVDQYILQHFGILLCQLSSSSGRSTTTTIGTKHGTTNNTTTTPLTHVPDNDTDDNQQNHDVSSLWYQWCIQESEIYGWEGKLAAIIVLDQFSRHVHRGLVSAPPPPQSSSSSSFSTTTTTPTTNDTHHEINIMSASDWEYIQTHLPKQAVLDDLAYTTTQLLLKHHTREFYSTSIVSIPMRIFAIMPLRHQSKNVAILQQTQHIIDTIFTIQQESCHHMIQSFRKATNRRLAVLQDETRRTGTTYGSSSTTTIIIGDPDEFSGCGNENDDNDESIPVNNHNSNHPSRPIHNHRNDNKDNGHNDDATQISKIQPQQQQQQQFTDDDILECGHFIPEHPCTAPIHHMVYTTIQKFLDQYVMKENNNTNISTSVTTETLTNTTPSSDVVGPEVKSMLQQSHHRNSIIVSLSGGVDSMVICAVLSHLQKYHQHYQNLHIIAIHIDYANRPESYQESKYVQQYCQHILGNVTFHCRRIDEVTRGITARDVYERVARDIRYQFYRDIIQMHRTESTSTQRHTGPRPPQSNTAKDTVGVLLGHHRGDLRENVLSNAHKGCGPLDLSGMTAISHNDGVVLLRPLLPLEKSFIFDYAHKFGIPYFKDTTPHWSTRGKLRNKLLPLLEEIYGEGSMNNLSNLAVESDECRGLLHTVMIQPFLDSIVYHPMGISFATAKWIDQGVYFWKIVLREALHSAGLGMFSDKSVESFIKRVCCTNIHEGWLQCRKDYGVYLRNDGCIFVLYPASFPWGNPPAVKNLIQSWTKAHANVECTDVATVLFVGPWTMTTSCYKLDEKIAINKLEQRVFTSMEAFMKGKFEYWLEIPPPFALLNNTNGDNLTDQLQSLDINQRQLLFTTFVKRTRPKAWKGIDPKIQDSLPLLGYVTQTEKGKQTDSNTDDKPVVIQAIEPSEKLYARIKLSLTTRESCTRKADD